MAVGRTSAELHDRGLRGALIRRSGAGLGGAVHPGPEPGPICARRRGGGFGGIRPTRPAVVGSAHDRLLLRWSFQTVPHPPRSTGAFLPRRPAQVPVRGSFGTTQAGGATTRLLSWRRSTPVRSSPTTWPT